MIETYQTVICGMSSAPVLAVRTLLPLAENQMYYFPKASEIVKQVFYLDDVLTGGATIEETLQRYN